MGVTIGTSAGFVTAAPTSDPTGSYQQNIDNFAIATFDTTPSVNITVTEMGWYCPTATEEANFEVGIYDDNSGYPGTLLYADRTHAKGTNAGWKVASGLNFSLSGSTKYWLVVQVDNTATTTKIDRSGVTGQKMCVDYTNSYIPDIFSVDLDGNNYVVAIYALYEASSTTTNPKLKQSGTFATATIKTKISGTFTEKPQMVKVGGTFQ